MLDDRELKRMRKALAGTIGAAYAFGASTVVLANLLFSSSPVEITLALPTVVAGVLFVVALRTYRRIHNFALTRGQRRTPLHGDQNLRDRKTERPRFWLFTRQGVREHPVASLTLIIGWYCSALAITSAFRAVMGDTEEGGLALSLLTLSGVAFALHWAAQLAVDHPLQEPGEC